MPSEPTEATLTIGELARRTGLSAAVIRTWESRHGFPVPQRLASGHRRYSPDDAARIRQIIQRRDAGVRLEVAVAETAATPGPTTGSIHAELRRRHPQLQAQELRKATLIGLSRAIEDECCAQAEEALLIGAFQRWDRFEPSAPRWRDLARTANYTLLFACEPPPEPDLPVAPIRASEAISREWAVIVDSNHACACLSAWELPGQETTADRDRRFETLFSVDPSVVREASRVALHLATQRGVSVPESALAHASAPAAPDGANLQAGTALFTRALGYLDRRR